VRRLTRGVIVALMTGLVTAGCGGGGPPQTASPVSSTPQAELPPGGSVQRTGSVTRHPGSSGRPSKAHGRLVVNNGKISICSLITHQQVDQIMGIRLPAPVRVIVGTFDECATIQRHGSPAARLHVAWAVPPDSNPRLVFRRMTVNLPQSDAIQGLGENAYCSSSARPLSSRLFVIVGRNLLEVFADTCDHARALARDALSGL
jgi:hypothetical protein